MTVAYGVGALVGEDFPLESVASAEFSSFRSRPGDELREFARAPSREEVASSSELAILARVSYPLLPDQTFGPRNANDPRTVWRSVVVNGAVGFNNRGPRQRCAGHGPA